MPFCILVAPLVGAWIEIPPVHRYQASHPSLPSWERGLKYKSTCNSLMHCHVAPLVGAWIEISFPVLRSWLISVAPLVGAWIEI